MAQPRRVFPKIQFRIQVTVAMSVSDSHEEVRACLISVSHSREQNETHVLFHSPLSLTTSKKVTFLLPFCFVCLFLSKVLTQSSWHMCITNVNLMAVAPATSHERGGSDHVNDTFCNTHSKNIQAKTNIIHNLQKGKNHFTKLHQSINHTG